MRSSSVKWSVGIVVFFLPTIAVIVTNGLLRQSLPEVFWTSLVLAAVVTPALLLSSGVTRKRIAFAFGLWVLLGVQFCLILLCLLAGFRE